jgi:DNA-binding transcriptional regulator YiaG
MGQRHSQRSKVEFAEEVKAWRKWLGKERRLKRPASQREAAEFLGISVRTLQNWEIARTRPSGPALGLLRRVMDGPVL